MKVKNNTLETGTWAGQEIEPGAYYEIQTSESQTWAQNAAVLASVLTSELVVNDGSDISDPVTGLNTLVGLIPQEVKVKETVAPQPFAQPAFRTKRNAGSAWVTVAPGESQTVDFILPEELYVHGGEFMQIGAEMGDYLTAEVADPNGVIPEAYRAALCESWPTVAKYCLKEWVHPARPTKEINTYPLNAKVTAGLALRVTYQATSEGTDRKIAMNYWLTKKL
jgi:hypothetical protein